MTTPTDQPINLPPLPELTTSTYGVGLIKFCAPITALRYLAKRLREAGIDSSVADDYAQSIEFLLARRDDLAPLPALATSTPKAAPPKVAPPDCAAQSEAQSPALLFAHDDGRHAVAHAGAEFLVGDPAWHRIGPVEMRGAQSPQGVQEQHKTAGDAGATQQSPQRAGKPMFAVAVAARKWDGLQAEGSRMQLISFDGSIKGPGTIDPWGVVRWLAPAQQSPQGGEAAQASTYCKFCGGEVGCKWCRAAQAGPAPSAAKLAAEAKGYADSFARQTAEHGYPPQNEVNRIHVHVAIDALAALASQAGVPLCMCKDQAASSCPGEWEPGCDLGNNEAHVRVSPQPTPASIQKAGALGRSEQAGPVALPSPNEIVASMAAVARGSICPLCGLDRPHDHTPREIIIYRNGLKRGLLQKPWTGADDQGVAEDAGTDSRATCEAVRFGAHEHYEHRGGAADADGENTKENCSGPGILRQGAVRVGAVELERATAQQAEPPQALAVSVEMGAEGQWLPIETAPKDGTEILLWRDDCGQFIGSYTSGDNFPLTQDEIDMMAEEVLFQKDWFTQWPDARRLEGSELPTHWQPLPAAPNRSQDTAA